METTGIYKIESSIKPERVYIGSALDIQERWRLHLSSLKNDKHINSKFQNHYNKYGGNDLTFVTLLGCDLTELIQAEQVFLNVFKPWFNICTIAGSNLGLKRSEKTRKKMSEARNGRPAWNKGKRLSEEHKRKLSESQKGEKSCWFGKNHSEEHKQKIGESQKDKILSEEHKRKIGEAHKGKNISEEHKKRISDALRGEKNHNYGKVFPKETRRKMSEAGKGKKLSEETRKKMSESHKGKRNHFYGEKHSEETKMKMKKFR